MEISVLLNAHENIPLIQDTIDSIKTYMSDQILLVIDGKYWNSLKDIPLNVYKLKGMYHGLPRSPFKNVALGLKSLYETFPKSNWYCYIEYDCLVTSSYFKKSLQEAEKKGLWMLGNDGRISPQIKIEFLEEIIRTKIHPRAYYYMLGCCQFFSHKFLEALMDREFFDNFLFYTNTFQNGFYPNYSGYDISEHLYPTLARALGGNIGVFASWDITKSEWHGNFHRYPMRWKPDLESAEDYPFATIMHPIKDYKHSIRSFHRERRINEKCNSGCRS